MATIVVNLSKKYNKGLGYDYIEPFRNGSNGCVYIGRHNGWMRLKKSPWHNPYKVDTKKKKKDGTREEVIEKYRAYILSRPDLLERLPELVGKTLGCWCKPKCCHGDVLVELIRERLGDK